jgi:hypothetical protein
MTYCFYIEQGEPQERDKVAWAEQHGMTLAFVDREIRHVGRGQLLLEWGHIASTEDRPTALLYKLTWGGA